MATPIENVLKVIDLFTLADVCKVSRSLIYYWMSNVRGEANGFIPTQHIPTIYKYARNKKLPLSLAQITGCSELTGKGKRK
jgi:hypothetical protein